MSSIIDAMVRKRKAEILSRRQAKSPTVTDPRTAAGDRTFDLMRNISPDVEGTPFETPWHFEPLELSCDKLAWSYAFSGPPQHGKTQIILHALVRRCIVQPKAHHAYVTYSLGKAQEQAKKFQALLDLAGVPYSGTLAKTELKTGGSIRFASLDSALTGDPISGLCVIDDAYKSWEDAYSAKKRATVEIVYRTTIVPRLHPGSTIVSMMTRWHPRDLFWLIAKDGVPAVNIPAIAELGEHNYNAGREIGEALWPSVRPLKWLETRRAILLAHEWAAMFQGRPTLIGSGVFGPANYYRTLPATFRGAYGLDLAYTASTKADHSVLLGMLREETGQHFDDGTPNPLFYLPPTEYFQKQTTVDVFADAVLVPAVQRNPGWPMAWRCAGPERGSAQLLKRAPYNIPIQLKTPPGDKLVSATDAAVAWNRGRILLPDPATFGADAKWVPEFVDVVNSFTGSDGDFDDPVDALGNAHVLLKSAIIGESKSGVAMPRRSKEW